MKKIFLALVWLVLFICGCAPRLIVEKTRPSSVIDIPMVQVQASENTAWWGPVRSKLKKQIMQGLMQELVKYPILLVNKNPDVLLVVEDIHTSGWREDIQIEEVTLAVLAREGEIFRVVYKQDHFKLPDDWHRVWKYPKTVEQISAILAQRVIKELGAGW